jgi:hypothetical protein
LALLCAIVIAGLDPAIQGRPATLDARVKPEHDKVCVMSKAETVKTSVRSY